MGQYSMPRYFQNMPMLGKELRSENTENIAVLKAVEQEIKDLIKKVEDAGRSTESLNEAGQMTAMQRILALVDQDTWRPLNSL